MLGATQLGSRPLGAGEEAYSSGGAVTHTLTGALVGDGAILAGETNRLRNHVITGALVGDGAQIVGATALNKTHALTGALVGGGAIIVGSTARLAIHDLVGALIGSGASVTGITARSGSAVTHYMVGALIGAGAQVVGVTTLFGANIPQPAVGGGIGHGHKRPQLIVVSINGQDYRVRAENLDSFLEEHKEKAKTTKPKIKAKKSKTKIADIPVLENPEKIIIKSAPLEYKVQTQAAIDRTNEILRKMWESNLTRLINEAEEEEALALVLMMEF